MLGPQAAQAQKLAVEQAAREKKVEMEKQLHQQQLGNKEEIRKKQAQIAAEQKAAIAEQARKKEEAAKAAHALQLKQEEVSPNKPSYFLFPCRFGQTFTTLTKSNPCGHRRSARR